MPQTTQFRSRPAALRPRTPAPVTYNPQYVTCPSCRAPVVAPKHIFHCSQINGNNGSATNTDDHANPHQHMSSNRHEAESVGQFLRSAARGLRPSSHISDNLATQLSGMIGLGLPAAWYASDSSPLTDKSGNDDLTHEQWLARNKQKKQLVGVELNPGPQTSEYKIPFEDSIHRPQHKPGTQWEWKKDPPMQPLVGVEPNPGPIKFNLTAGKSHPPRKRKMQQRKYKQKQKQKERPVVVQPKVAVVKSNNNRVRAKIPRELSLLRRVANQYARFLKSPHSMPPRIGSTGNNPTRFMHGFFIGTYPFVNINSLPSTEFMAYLAPKFRTSGSVSTSVAPLTVCFSNSPSINFQDATNSTITKVNYTNSAGFTSAVNNARLSGMSISIDCRCPATDKKPYVYAGLWRNNDYVVAGDLANNANQISNLNSSQVRGSYTSVELTGMTASSVYLPGDTNNFKFSTYIANSNSDLINVPIPYVGMTGCSNNTTVSIYVTAWYELMSTTDALFTSAEDFKVGPKIDANDLFNELPAMNPVSSKIISTGIRTTTGFQSSAMVPMLTTAVESSDEKLARLENTVKQLTLKIEEDEEKYISCDEPVTPVHNSLSQSTIMQLQQIIGSKTTPKSLP